MKKLILIISMFTMLFSNQNEVLKAKDAFKTTFEETKTQLNVNINIAKNVYIYKDKIKVTLGEEQIDITNLLNFPSFKNYKEFLVYFEEFKLSIPFDIIASKTTNENVELKVKFQGCSYGETEMCYSPITEKYTLVLKKDSKIETVKTTQTNSNESLNETDFIVKNLKESNIFVTLLAFFGFGLLLSLTPCVFPMIPILSSIIVNAGQKGKITATKGFTLSLIYVLSMSIAYAIAGVIAGIFGANLQMILQNEYVLISFAAVFAILSLSMFGYFKLEIPNSLQQKLNKVTIGKESSGILGIVIMGFLSSLIVGPCVAPPLAGALVYIGQTGDALLGGIALFVMSIGMGIPLLLIGIGFGKFMPKPGGWMETVSKVFGIIMLGVAIWLLSRVLDATLIILLLSILFIGTSIYFSKFKNFFMELFSKITLLLGVLLFIGAFTGATNPLKPLENLGGSTVLKQNTELNFKTIKTLKELEEEINKSDKTVMIDFTAQWCSACKEYEHITFQDEAVKKELDRFLLLKVDVTNNTQEDQILMDKYDIFGPPAILFYGKDKKLIEKSKIIGYKNPQEFLEILKMIF